MDLGLSGKACLVTGSTGGIGLETARLLVRRGRAGRHLRPQRSAGDRRDAARPRRPRRSRARRAASSRRRSSARRPRRAREQRRLRGAGALRGRARRGLGLDVAAERDELRARDPRGAAARCARATGVDRQRLLDRGQAAVGGMPHYSVTKAAVLSLSRLVADLYAGDGIRCNAVTPGPDGDRGVARRGRPRRPAGRRPRRGAREGRRRRPLGRLAEPEEIAAVIAFLALRPGLVRHRRRLVRRRRHRPDHHLTSTPLTAPTA